MNDETKGSENNKMLITKKDVTKKGNAVGYAKSLEDHNSRMLIVVIPAPKIKAVKVCKYIEFKRGKATFHRETVIFPTVEEAVDFCNSLNLETLNW